VFSRLRLFALHRAFDARECGIATKRQLALLDRAGF
jgi:hypothetical protein